MMRAGERTLRLLLEPIAPFLDGMETNEIVCQEPGTVGVETAGRWAWHDMPIMDYDRLDGIATLAAAMTQQDVGPTHPLCASVLPDGQRIQISRPPVVPAGTVGLSIRCPPRFRPTMDTLAEFGVFDGTRAIGGHAPPDWRSFFAEQVRAYRTILVTGKTGSGKTTVARALATEFGSDERVVTVEDTPELMLTLRNLVAYAYSKGDQGIARTQSEDLLEAALRMRPDRIVQGELRDGAALTFMRSVAAGHPGSITTCHARSAEGAFDALRLMVKMHDAGRHMADADVLSMLRGMIDLVAHCEKLSDGRRVVSEVFFRRSP